MMATRSVSTASTTFVAANAITTRSMLKDPTEVFVAVVNEDDKTPPLLILLTLSKLKRSMGNENLQLWLPGDR